MVLLVDLGIGLLLVSGSIVLVAVGFNILKEVLKNGKDDGSKK